MFATSPAESVHALDHSALSAPSITFWTAREAGGLLGCGARNLGRLYLETGTEDYFAPARRLYARNGFTECPPFADYALDPNSVFMELRL